MLKITILPYLLFWFFLCWSASAQISYQNAFPNIDFTVPVEIQASVDGAIASLSLSKTDA